ncbi:unnamed protein product [Natator depressus]
MILPSIGWFFAGLCDGTAVQCLASWWPHHRTPHLVRASLSSFPRCPCRSGWRPGSGGGGSQHCPSLAGPGLQRNREAQSQGCQSGTRRSCESLRRGKTAPPILHPFRRWSDNQYEPTSLACLISCDQHGCNNTSDSNCLVKDVKKKNWLNFGRKKCGHFEVCPKVASPLSDPPWRSVLGGGTPAGNSAAGGKEEEPTGTAGSTAGGPRCQKAIAAGHVRITGTARLNQTIGPISRL